MKTTVLVDAEALARVVADWVAHGGRDRFDALGWNDIRALTPAPDGDAVAVPGEDGDGHGGLLRQLGRATKLWDEARIERDAAVAEIEEAWRLLGGRPDVDDDPEVSALPDALRVSLQYERDQTEFVRAVCDAAIADRDRLRVALALSEARQRVAPIVDREREAAGEKPNPTLREDDDGS